jgi:quinol monooxygenase YgiN
MHLTTVTLVTLIHARPGRAEALRVLLAGAMAEFFAAPGCLDQSLEPCPGQPDTWLFRQLWATEAAFQRSGEEPPLAGMFDALIRSGTVRSLQCHRRAGGVKAGERVDTPIAA